MVAIRVGDGVICSVNNDDPDPKLDRRPVEIDSTVASHVESGGHSSLNFCGLTTMTVNVIDVTVKPRRGDDARFFQNEGAIAFHASEWSSIRSVRWSASAVITELTARKSAEQHSV